MKRTTTILMIEDIECPPSIDPDSYYNVRASVEKIRDRMIHIRADIMESFMEFNARDIAMSLRSHAFEGDIDQMSKESVIHMMADLEGDAARILHHLKLCYIGNVGEDSELTRYIGNSPQVSLYGSDELVLLECDVR